MAKKLIVDSSPLIVLLKSDLENLLPELFDEIIVPETVWQEILAGPEGDIAKQKLLHILWVKRILTIDSIEILEKYNLGKGETSVLSLAGQFSGSRILLDDYAAGKCAKLLNLQVFRTGGLVLLAKQKGLIPSVSEALTKVQKAGLWLSEQIIKMIVEKAGE